MEKQGDFKSRLNYAMDLRGIRPVDLAMMTGISESAISQYRSGYAKPKDDRRALIADALNVDPSWLMGMNVPMEIRKDSSGSLVITMPGDYIVEEANGIIRCLDEDNAKRALAYMKKLFELQKDEEELQ